jgi:ATP-binding cassette, subfamily C, bacterial CydCD
VSGGAAGIDRGLLRRARAARRFIGLSAGLGFGEALLIVAQAWLIAYVVAEAFIGGRGVGEMRVELAALLGVALARAALAWAAELTAVRASSRAKSELRGELLARGADLVARGDERARTGGLAILASRGIDALDDYFSQYLPHLILAVIAPATIVVAVLADDWISGLIVLATLPLIPIFMALVGAVTGERVDRQLGSLERLAGHFLDVVAGLPTLKIFGRSRAQLATIGSVSELYRTSTVATLRVTFLSSLILELVATVSVALVAVAIGIRLSGGDLGFRAGLFALILAPEAYLPLRRLAASYHSSAEGVQAAGQAFAVIDAPARSGVGADAVPDLDASLIAFEEVGVTYPGRSEPAVAGASFELHPGEVLGLTGPSGCGKSTLLTVMLGLIAPDGGSARVGGVEIAALDARAWHESVAWVPQRPYVFRGSLRENVRLSRTHADDEEVRAALWRSGLLEKLDELPDGLDTRVGEGGRGLSAGERRRLALARAILRDAPLLLLDEPTAGLDLTTERSVVVGLRDAVKGRTVVIVSHRPAPLELCDRVVAVGREAVAA